MTYACPLSFQESLKPDLISCNLDRTRSTSSDLHVMQRVGGGGMVTFGSSSSRSEMIRASLASRAPRPTNRVPFSPRNSTPF